MTQAIIETYRLTKRFGSVTAVDEVYLHVNKGEVFGFLGPNGAGKTTTIGMLLGLIHPTSGRVELFGVPISPAHTSALNRVGSSVGLPGLYPYLTGRAHLSLLAAVAPEVDDQRITHVLNRVGLLQAADRKVAGYSTGMRQRMGLAAALLHEPSLLILDEPTNGLDPAGRRFVRNLLRSLADEGVTIFLSSHLLHEVEQVCDRVAIINQGKIITSGSVGELVGAQRTVRVRVARPEEAVRLLRTLTNATAVRLDGEYVEVSGMSSEAVVSYLVQHGHIPNEVSTRRIDLESLFLELTDAEE